MRTLEEIKQPYRVVVEEQELEAYAQVIDPAKLLVLDPIFQANYEAMCELPEGASKGSGPARNFAWEHSISEGHAWHWCVDDNIRDFYRLNQNHKIRMGDGMAFRVMEDFCLRYENVAMAGPHYELLVPRKKKVPPFIINSRIYSCNLIRNDVPFRWRCRYNEDTDLSLRMLKAGWCTILFHAFLQNKMPTLRMKGGNTDEIYKFGTRAKSEMLARLHPDCAKVITRWGRVHHHVDYKRFRTTRLVRRKDVVIPQGVNEYGMKITTRGGAHR